MLLKVDFECLYPGNNTSSNYIYHNDIKLHISVVNIKLHILCSHILSSKVTFDVFEEKSRSCLVNLFMAWPNLTVLG